MLSKHFGSLVLAVVSAAVLAAPTLSEAIPFFGKSRCKDEKTRLHHEETILRDRQRLALHQCHATLDAAHDRCQSLKRRQKDELKLFQDRGKGQLEECKARTRDKRGEKNVRKKDDRKKADQKKADKKK